MLIKFVRIH